MKKLLTILSTFLVAFIFITCSESPSGIEEILPGQTVIDSLISESNIVDIYFKDVQDETGYKIFRKSFNSNDFSFIGETEEDVTSYQDVDLSSNTLYFYKVKAFNGEGDGPFSEIDSVETSLDIPQTPTLNDLSLENDSTILVEWSDVENELLYYIFRSDTVNNQFFLLDSSNQNVTSYTDFSNITYNTFYYYKIQAKNNDGLSEFSNIKAISTSDEQFIEITFPNGGESYFNKLFIA